MSLRNYLNKIKPQFEEGGKLHSFKSLYDGFDTFCMCLMPLRRAV